MINKNIPLYMQIAEDFRKDILSEKYEIGAKIPTEEMIIEQYGVSRMTGRQAVNELVAEGLVYKVHGKGVFVSKKKLQRNLNRLNGFHEEMTERGYSISSKILEYYKRLPIQEEQITLNIKQNQEVYYIKRIRYLDNVPIALQHLVVPAFRVPGLDKIDLSNQSFYSFLENNGTPISKANQSMEAIIDKAIADEMGIPQEQPFFYFERTSYDKNDIPLEMLKSYFRGDEYSYAITLYRD